MADMAIHPPTPGTLQVRTHFYGAEQSRTSDFAAVAAGALADEAGTHVAVICATTDLPNMVETIGCGWHEPRLHLARARDLLGATAAIARARRDAHGADLVVIIDDLQALDTGAASGHDDRVCVAWLDAVLDGDTSALRDLTGLDVGIYLAGADATPTTTTLVVGGRHRRNSSGDLSGIMGGTALVTRASSVTHLEAATGDMAAANARLFVLKARDGMHPAVELTRSTRRPDPWRAA